MKKRIVINLFLLFFLAYVEPVVSNNKFGKKKNSEYSKIKSNKLDDDFKAYFPLRNNKVDIFLTNEEQFNIPLKLNYFFDDLLANLENDSLEVKKELPSVVIDSDKQTRLGSLIIAEGNVVVKSKNSILNASKLSYDQELKVLILKGNIKFYSKDSFLEASDIEYDFIKKKGFILNAYGSANFEELSKIKFSDDNSTSNIPDDIFNYDLVPNEVKFNNQSNIKLSNFKRNNEGDDSYIEGDLEIKFNPIIKTRFLTKKIDIKDGIWLSEDLTITNDPFNEPQLIIKNKNFQTIFNEDNTKIRSQWSWARIEDKISIPLGPRRIDADKEQDSTWGNGYDKGKYDGFYFFRRLNKINLSDSTDLNLTTFFPIQRIISGKTESFPNNNDLVISPKVKQDIKFSDYLGLGALLKSEKNNLKYILDLKTNSLDFEKLDKATEINSFLKINLSKKEISNKVNSSKKQDLKKINYNYKKSDDLTLFGNYRNKTKNGSLGEIVVKSSYGIRYDSNKSEEINKTKIFTEKSISIGNYESTSRINPNNLINKNRLNISLKKGYEFPIWQPKVESFINDEYKYSPIVIPQGLFWNVEGNLDFFRYDGGYKQDLFLVKSGPKLTIGEYKRNLFDYTEISLMPRFKFNRGTSPFNFDQVVDNKAIELKVSQQIYGPILLSFMADLSLEKKESNEDSLINPIVDLGWNRRAYSFNLFYNFDSESGGINFKINTFDFKGSGERFN